MSGSLTRLITRNWAIKLAALALALMLYVAVAAQQPVTQTFSLKIVVLPPPGRALLAAPPTVSVLLSGRGSEMLRLRSLRPITLRVPDTLTASVCPAIFSRSRPRLRTASAYASSAPRLMMLLTRRRPRRNSSER